MRFHEPYTRTMTDSFKINCLHFGYFTLEVWSLLQQFLGMLCDNPAKLIFNCFDDFHRHALREYNIHKSLDHPVSTFNFCFFRAM